MRGKAGDRGRARTRRAIAGAALLAVAALGMGQAATGAPLSGAAPGAARHAAAPMVVVPVEAQDFESAAFPPPRWRVFDAFAQQNGLPPRYQWSREGCDLAPDRGGQAATWAVGDGSAGSALPCAGLYTEAVDSFLIFGPIDTTTYDGGLQVSLDRRLDERRPQAFLLCATDTSPTGYACFASPIQQAGWGAFGQVHFPNAGGQANGEIWIYYRDREPDGTHFGVFVDNVVIEGLTTAITSTPTTIGGETPTAVPNLLPAALRGGRLGG